MIKTSNYKEIKQLAIKSSLRSLTHTYIELKDGNSLPSDWAEKHKSFLAPIRSQNDRDSLELVW